MTETQASWVTLEVADGSSMRAYEVKPASGSGRAGLLVYQEAFGVNAHIRDVAERLAREGYLALAPELYHRTASGFEGAYDNFEAVMPQMRALTEQGLKADVRAAHTWLSEHLAAPPKPIACIGFCMGGRVSFLTNAVVPVKAAISFYGGGIAPNPMSPGLLGRATELQAPQLFFWGGLDKHIGPEQRQAVVDAVSKTGKVYVNVEFSDADHGFFCDARPSYNAKAAQQAWALTHAFLNCHLGS